MVYILDSEDNVKASSIAKIYRWVLILQNFRLKVFHISSEENLFMDKITRWGYYGQPFEVGKNELIPKLLYPATRDGDHLRIGNIELINAEETPANMLLEANDISNVFSGREYQNLTLLKK